jgi:hypothetical protein
MQESLADFVLCVSVDLLTEQRGGKSRRRLKVKWGRLRNTGQRLERAIPSISFVSISRTCVFWSVEQYRSVLTATER